jgi:2-polyprenyl-6-methoxyphenol hydroxylase-like FAD-dependent oxidoreductase
MQSLDVAIVGGGPSGLATAIALKRAMPAVKCQVFERARYLPPAAFPIINQLRDYVQAT